ncbi:hypothetical protein CSA37_06725 [Candidatus Fermentibacteria bacterium]|nr:MAG: hypothetical protein CSA37_06725 [Candidatus Fermentibacteria bacterium]
MCTEFLTPFFGGLLKNLVLLFALSAAALSGIVEDCNLRGIPVTSALVSDELLTVEMEGSLAMGDSLLKHYGGVFFLLADSISAGWPVVGLQVDITGASLILFREDVFSAVERMQQGLDESVLASWILEHTWVTDQGL